MTRSPLIIFTTAPTGLGHLRVLNALIEGLQSNKNKSPQKYIKLGLENFRANKIHALGSRVPFFTSLTEFYQTNPIAESFVSLVYTTYLKTKTGEILQNFAKIARNTKKKSWIVVCTHFAMAHSIAAARELILQKLGVRLFLCVVVTDDSPQKVWAVSGADIIFSPSGKTTKKLSQYTNNVVTIPFPVSPSLAQPLRQPTLPTYFQIPVSGAAVQLPFFEDFISASSDFSFYLVGQETIYTTSFFEKFKGTSNTKLFIGKDAEQTIELYQKLFDKTPRAMFEITKPSEQIFKSLFTPQQKGGVILLLTAPIGRQEKDNIGFLKRHGLIGTRALILPIDPIMAAGFVKEFVKSKKLTEMLKYKKNSDPELEENGVEQICARLARLAQQTGTIET